MERSADIREREQDREHRSILLDLESADEEIRRLAVERLAGRSCEDALPRLVACLGDPGWRVRKAAVERLAEAPAAWPVAEALVAALSDGENPGRRNAAVEALVRRGESVVDPLLEATASDDHDVRKLAVDTLAGLGTPRAVPRLREVLADPDPNVRAAAADALGAIGGEAVAPALLDQATRPDEDRLVVFSALRALAHLEVAVPAARLEPVLQDSLLRPAAYAVLGHADEEDVAAEEALLKGLVSTSRSSREAAMEALLRRVGRSDPQGAARLSERVRETLAGEPLDDALARLRNADLPTRLVLIQFLGLLRRPEAAVPILRAGVDEALAEVALASLCALGGAAGEAFDAAWSDLDPESRCLACTVVARTGGELGRARLLAALEEPDAGVRSAAARALGELVCAEALPALMHRLEAVAAREDEGPDPEREDELAAVTGGLVALASQGGEALRHRAVELLGQRLEGAPEPVRLALAAVLGRIGRPSDASLVEWLLKDPSAGVRREAVQALGRLEEGAASEPLRLALADESPAVRIAAARALGASQSPRALEDLERLADDEEPRVRAAALHALGRRALGADPAEEPARERALARLEAALADEGSVAMAAVEALATLGTPRAAQAALRLLEREDPELVKAAVACIGAHGEGAALEELVPLVAHPHWAVRAEAIGTLAERSVRRAVPAILRRLEKEQDDFARDAILRGLRKLEA